MNKSFINFCIFVRFCGDGVILFVCFDNWWCNVKLLVELIEGFGFIFRLYDRYNRCDKGYK